MIITEIFCIVSVLFVAASGSSFMQWSRPMNGELIGTIGSVAGINVLSYKNGNGTLWQTDIVDSDTGVLMLGVSQEHPFELAAVITPSEDSNGYFTCEPLYKHPGEGSLSSQPLWCGVLQVSTSDTFTGSSQIILPNASIVPLLGGLSGTSVPWQCSQALPCVIRSQELRVGQLGGCHRRQNSSATQTGPTDFGPVPHSPPQSTHVTIRWNTTLYLFRPLEVAAAKTPSEALALISSRPLDPSAAMQIIDHSLQYLSIAYALHQDRGSTVDGHIYQCLVCALAFIDPNGTVTMYDSERNDNVVGVDSLALLYFTTVSPAKIDGSNGQCTPSIESSQKLLPLFNQSFRSNLLYNTILVLTCAATGNGYLFDIAVNAPAMYPADVNVSGSFTIPAAFNVSDRAVGAPFSTDTVFVLSQPYQYYFSNVSEISERISPWYSYAVGIAVSRISPNEAVIAAGRGSSQSPPFAVMTFSSSTGSQHDMSVWLTQQLVGESTLRNVTLPNGSNHSIVNAIGWIAAGSLPAYMNLTGNAFSEQTQIEMVRIIATWAAVDGLTFAVFADGYAVLVNATSGQLATPHPFYVSDGGSTPHGGIMSAPQLQTAMHGAVFRSAPSLIWDVVSPGQIGRGTSAISSSYLVLTSPQADYTGDGVACTYALTAPSGYLSAFAQMQMFSENESAETQLAWTVEEQVLYNPFTLSYCASAQAIEGSGSTINIAAVHSAASVVLSLSTLNYSSASSVPLRNVVSVSNGVTFGLDSPNPEADAGPTIAINPIGSGVTIVCSQAALWAYKGVIGNLQWEFPFSSIPFCANLTGRAACKCPSDTSLLTTSADRQYLFAHVTVEEVSGVNKTIAGILALGASDGTFLEFFDPALYLQFSAECTATPPTTASIGPLTQVQPIPNNDFVFPLTWVGIATVPGTRCFVVLSIYCFFGVDCGLQTNLQNNAKASRRYSGVPSWTGDNAAFQFANRTQPPEPTAGTNGQTNLAFAASVLNLLGSWASFTSDVQFSGDLLFLKSDYGIQSASILSSIGYTVMGFSLSTILSKAAGISSALSAYPALTLNNVIDCVPIGNLWFTVQLQFDWGVTDMITLALNVFEFSAQPTAASASIVATYNTSDPDLISNLALVSVFSLPRVLIPVVCVAASNLTCLNANTQLGLPAMAPATTLVQYYGRPVVSDSCLMVFARDGVPCHTLQYTVEQSEPIVLWYEPTWEGMHAGVDMNINGSSCIDAVISSDGLLLMCRPNTRQGSSPQLYRNIYLLEALSGRVLLANGPAAMPTTTVLSDVGSTITIVSSLANNTAYSIQLVGSTAVEPIDLQGSFCLSEAMATSSASTGAMANYYMVFDTNLQIIQATMTPWLPGQESVEVLINQADSPAFPLSAPQFRGFAGVKLGITYTIEQSVELLILLLPALPPSIRIQNSLSFIRGQPTILTTFDFSVSLVSSGGCAACDSLSCPKFCGVDISNGNEYMYAMQPASNSYSVFLKPYPSPHFIYNSSFSVSFSGNASLGVLRIEAAISASVQTFPCSDDASFTQVFKASGARSCTGIPGFNGMSYVTIEISPDSSFASVSTYTNQFGSAYYTSKESVQTTPVWMIDDVISITNLIQLAMQRGSFPSSLPGGPTFLSVASINAALLSSYPSIELSMNTMTGPVVVTLTQPGCEVMDSQIRVCASAFGNVFEPSTAETSLRTIVWKGTDASNWGDGFVAADFEVSIRDILRDTKGGAPVQCGGDNNTCLAVCHPIAECGSQLTSYMNFYLQTNSVRAPGSEAVVTAPLIDSCTTQGVPMAAADLANMRVLFYCASDGNVTIATRQGGALLTLGTFKSGTLDSVVGAQFSCSGCAFFMHFGVISQPVGWIALGAVKSLVITLLFYLLLDRVRANNRLRTRLRNRHQQIVKRFQTLVTRLGEHELQGVTTEIECSAGAFVNVTDATNIAFSDNRPILEMSEAERAAEHRLLLLEIERAQSRVKYSENEFSAADSKRWWCTKWMPNPITVYSNIVVRLSGIRHPSERKALLVRVQDGLSSKEVTEQQLVDTLMHIINETDRASVEAFSHYYQWHMCLNRQVVIRDHIDETAHAGAPLFGEMLDQALLKSHNSLRRVYKEFCSTTRDRASLTTVLPAKDEDTPLLPTKSNLLTSSAKTSSRRLQPSPPEQIPLNATAANVQPYTPTENEMHVAEQRARSDENLRAEVDAFVALIPTYPYCFEYVALPSRAVDDKLMPNTLLLLFSVAQFLASIVVYSVNVTDKRSHMNTADSRSFDTYQCIFFLVFNSSTPSALLVSAVARADLGSLEHYQTWKTKLRDIFTDVYVWFILIIFLPPLATHVIPGIFLYCWFLLPPLLLAIWLEYLLRSKVASQTTLWIAARYLCRVLVLFAAAMVFTFAFNYSSMFIYSSPAGYMNSGSFRKVGYLQTIADDFNARSIGCLYEHITTSASNFLQAGFASLY